MISETDTSDFYLCSSSSLLSLSSWGSDSDTIYGDSSPSTLDTTSYPTSAPHTPGEGDCTHNARRNKTPPSTAQATTGRKVSPKARGNYKTKMRLQKDSDSVSSFSELSLSGASTGKHQTSGSSEMNHNYNRMPKSEVDSVFSNVHTVFSDTSSSSDADNDVSDGGNESNAEDQNEDDEEREARKQRKREEKETKRREKKMVEREEREIWRREEDLKCADIVNMTRIALHDMALKHEEVTHLSSLLIHFIFGSRDIVQEDPKTDRSVASFLL